MREGVGADPPQARVMSVSSLRITASLFRLIAAARARAPCAEYSPVLGFMSHGVFTFCPGPGEVTRL